MKKTTITRPQLSQKKGVPPREDDASGNLTKRMEGELVTFNFRVPVEFRKRVRQYALDNDTTAVQVMTKSVEEYIKK